MLPRRLAVLLLAALAPAAAVVAQAPLPSEHERFRHLFTRGRAALERRDYETAVEALSAAARIDPKHAPIHAHLGRALYHAHMYRRAEESLRRALELDPGNQETRMDLGRTLREQARFAEAMDVFRAVTAAQPSQAEAHFYVGQVHYQRGEYEEARRALGRAVELSPGQAIMRHQKGLALLRLGDLAGAERELRRALSIEPDYARALYSLAEVRERAGDAREAAELRARFDAVQRRAQEQEEKDARYRHHERLGLMALDRRDWPAALSELDTAAALRPREARIHTYRGIALSSAGRTDAAIAALQKAIELDAGQAPALTELGRLRAMRGEFQAARGHLERAVAANPNLIEAREFLANVYEDLGMPEASQRERRAMESLRKSGQGESIYD